jgi:hypothetical protein
MRHITSLHGLLAATLLATALTAPPALADDDLLGPAATREGDAAVLWNTKLTCGTTEQGVTRYGMWEGRMFSRIPGEKDRHIFDVVGINTRQCERHKDPARGEGYRSVSREIMVYLDPATGVNMRAPSFARDATGKPARVTLRQYGDLLVASREVPLFYENPLAGAYQDYIGGKYHAMEIFNTFYSAADFLAPKGPRISPSRLAWQRVSGLLPWLRMGDRPGVMIFNATGFSTFDRAQISPKLMQILQTRYPEYLTPPPLGDARPNATTWTITKDWIDAKRLKESAK